MWNPFKLWNKPREFAKASLGPLGKALMPSGGSGRKKGSTSLADIALQTAGAANPGLAPPADDARTMPVEPPAGSMEPTPVPISPIGEPPAPSVPIEPALPGANPPEEGGATTMDMVTLPDGTIGSRSQLQEYYRQHPEAAIKAPPAEGMPPNQAWYAMPQLKPIAQTTPFGSTNPYWQSAKSGGYGGAGQTDLSQLMGSRKSVGSTSGYGAGQ